MDVNKKYEARVFGLLVDWKHPQLDWGDVWYNFKLSVKSFKRFFHAIWWFRGNDSSKTLNLLKIALEEHRKTLSTTYEEIDEELSAINKCIDLLDNILEDDYSSRCGYDYNYKLVFTPLKGEEKYATISTTETEDQKINNGIAQQKAMELEQKEWDELFNTIKDYKYGLRTWQ